MYVCLLSDQWLGILNQPRGGAVEWWRFDCSFNPWNPIANLTGQPAMSLPLAMTPDGSLPIGIPGCRTLAGCLQTRELCRYPRRQEA